jgi:hypothetical protein
MENGGEGMENPPPPVKDPMSSSGESVDDGSGTIPEGRDDGEEGAK